MRTATRIAATFAVALISVGCSSGDPNLPETWIKKLDDSETKVRVDALDHLRKIGDKKAAAAVVPLLKDGKGDVKIAAIKTLSALGDPSVVPQLIDAIDFSVGTGADKVSKDANAANKEIAEAIEHFKAKAAIQPMVKLANTSRDDFVRVAAINALGSIADPTAVDALNKLAMDETLETYVNKKAVQALGEIGDPGAVPAIAKMLFHERKGVSFYKEASYAAYQIGPPAAQPLVEILEGKNETLNKWAQDHDVYREALYAKAAQVLGDLRDKDAVPTLVKYLNYTRPGVAPDDIDQLSLLVRMQAAEALGRMRVPEASPVIAKNLKVQESNTREAYIRALVAIGNKEVVPQLIACTHDGDVMDISASARTACYVGLSQLGEDKAWAQWQKWEAEEPGASEKTCLKGVSASDEEGKKLAAEHCKKQSEKIVKVLKDNEARLKAYDECKQDRACWEKKLKDKDPTVRERAALELGRINDKQALPALMESLRDDDLNARYAAILAVDWVASSGKEALELAKKGLTTLDKQIEDESGKVQYAKINEDLKRLAVKIRRLDRTGA